MRFFAAFSLIIALSAAALAQAQVYFSDLPEGHWAKVAVYDLVKQGVTAGYPDGTFRGKKYITRYEMASFLEKIFTSVSLAAAQKEKLIAELKSELAEVKFEKNKQAQQTSFSGEMQSFARLAAAVPRGAKLDYRFKFNLLKVFDENSSLACRLDTADAGFNSDTSRLTATSLVDIESKFKMADLDCKLNLGPGWLVHTENNDFFPCENNTIYLRPKTAVEVSKKIDKLKISSAYVTRQVETSGRIGVHELTGQLVYSFDKFSLSFQPRYVFASSGVRNLLAEAGLVFQPFQQWETSLLVAAGAMNAGNSGLYLKIIEEVADLFGSGINVTARFDRVGSQYRLAGLDKYEFIDLNNFDRLILDGTTDLGVRIDQRLSDKVRLDCQADYVTNGSYQYGSAYPETYFLCQFGLAYALSSATEFKAFFRSYDVPSGLAQFSDAVPTSSNLVGLKVVSSF